MKGKIIGGIGVLLLILAGLSNGSDGNQEVAPEPEVTKENQTETSIKNSGDTPAPAKQIDQEKNSDPISTEAPEENCSAIQVGYVQDISIKGENVSIWYPTTEAARTYSYSDKFSSELAYDATPSQCEDYPLIVFSHGFSGCKAQSIFFTEKLAEAGYIVVAVDHKDALCNGNGLPIDLALESSLFEPEKWSDKNETDRRDDVKNVISGMLSSSKFKGSIDTNKIGVAGHSLGGYTALGLGGAWDSWRDNRVKAVLAFSPFSMPFTSKDTIKNIDVPVMYQGAMFDVFITPFLEGPDGAYTETPAPAYFVKLIGGTHFEWTNLLCGDKKTTDACVNGNGNLQLINKYGIAFFDKHLKGHSPSVLNSKWGLAEYLSK